MNIIGLAVVAIQYVSIAICAFVIARARGKTPFFDGDVQNLLVGVCTLSAYMVGGNFVTSSAEVAFSTGVVYSVTGVALACSLWLGGLIFGRHHYSMKGGTMLGPISKKYGAILCAVYGKLAIAGEVLELAVVLSLLVGVHLVVVLSYVMFRGVSAMLITDVIQLIIIAVGLVAGVGASIARPKTIQDVRDNIDDLVGDVPSGMEFASYFDILLSVTLGSFTYQSYFLRLYSIETSAKTQWASVISGFVVLLLSVPPNLIGMVARAAEWNATDIGRLPDWADTPLILPLSFTYLCPLAVSILGMCAIAAAMMVTSEGNVLSASMLFVAHIYVPSRGKICRTVGGKERAIVQRIVLFVTAAVAGVVSQTIPVLLMPYYIVHDLMFIVIFPQLMAALYLPSTNTYGAICGFVAGVLFYSVSAYDHYRTLSMVLNLVVTIVVSLIVKTLLERGYLPRNVDVFKCYPKDEGEKDEGDQNSKSGDGGNETEFDLNETDF